MEKLKLQDQLISHIAADSQEEQHRQDMLALLKNVQDPFSRYEFNPGHFTASAFVVSPDAGSLLMIFHHKLRLWIQPGGHIEDFDQSITQAAERELLEETGVEAALIREPLDLDVHQIPAHADAPRHKHYDIRCFYRSKRSEIFAGHGVKEARWVPLKEVSSLGTDESVLRAVRTIRRLLSWG